MDGGNGRRPGEVVRSWVKVRGRGSGTGAPRDGSAGGSGSPAEPPWGMRRERRGRPQEPQPRLAPPRGWGAGQPPPRRHRGSRQFALRFPSGCAAGNGGVLPRDGSCRRDRGTSGGSGDAGRGCRQRRGVARSGAWGAPCVRGGAARPAAGRQRQRPCRAGEVSPRAAGSAPAAGAPLGPTGGLGRLRLASVPVSLGPRSLLKQADRGRLLRVRMGTGRAAELGSHPHRI